ncbi:unnamed protein product [Microthlaspi erraticum]|uniref:Uncharacterized protein n=1 Tax=Microthlaspi erraticum TaxID=1685480 RepID=A0A6D2JFV3_9BRAS|nr:unnamed protein product [Microthlaspi erraticum]
MDSMSEAFDQMQMVKDVLANSDKVSEVLQESTHQFNLLTSPTFLPKHQSDLSLHGREARHSWRHSKEPRVGKDKDERGPRIEKPRLERARVEKPRSERPRADRLVQAPCVLDEESLQALFDEPLGRALKEGEDTASKAKPGDKRKDPPAQAPSVKPSQLTMTLFPTKFENGKIEYKIRYKGRSRPFSRAKALVTSEQSRDPTKLKELLSQVFWSILEHMGHKEHGGTWHMEAAQLDTQRKKGEAILKTSSTVYSTGQASTRSS